VTVSDSALLSSLSTLSSFLTAPSVVAFLGSISISLEIYELLSNEFQTDANKKVASKELGEAKSKEKEALRIKREN
jgi:translation initiation factor IF-2